jgi:hypothetical protein
MKKILIIVLMSVFITCNVTAQHINNIFAFKSEKNNSLLINLEFDPAIFWGITYNRNIDVSIGDFKRTIVGQVGWKTYRFNYNDLNLNFFSAVSRNSSFNIITNIGAENKYLENTVHKANIYHWVVGLMPGYYSDRWYVGVEGLSKWLIGAKFTHTEYYREVYPEVKDGWYSYRNGYVHLSLNLGAKISDRLDVDFRAGYRFTHDFKDYQPYIIPYFTNTAFNFRF